VADLYLASLSARRRALLAQIGVFPKLVRVAVDESPKSGETAFDLVQRLAVEKAVAGSMVLGHGAEAPVLAADTAVVVDGEILGKPEGREHALRMLRTLSGRTHRVYTGVALVCGSVATRVSVSEVCFRPIASEEAEAYWATGEPQDKAGGYAIQGLGAVFVSSMKGSFSGIVGLPLFETTELLEGCGIHLLQASASRHRPAVPVDPRSRVE